MYRRIETNTLQFKYRKQFHFCYNFIVKFCLKVKFGCFDGVETTGLKFW